jgi:hypothetical protein
MLRRHCALSIDRAPPSWQVPSRVGTAVMPREWSPPHFVRCFGHAARHPAWPFLGSDNTFHNMKGGFRAGKWRARPPPDGAPLCSWQQERQITDCWCKRPAGRAKMLMPGMPSRDKTWHDSHWVLMVGSRPVRVGMQRNEAARPLLHALAARAGLLDGCAPRAVLMCPDFRRNVPGTY